MTHGSVPPNSLEAPPETVAHSTEFFGQVLVLPKSPFLLVMSGPSAGTLVAAQDGLVIGRAESADLVLDSPSVSRRHAMVRVSETDDVSIIDLDSQNALIHEGKRVKACDLSEFTTVQIGEVIVSLVRLENFNNQVCPNLVRSGSVDFLTGLLTEHALSSALREHFLAAARHATPLSYLLLAVDQLDGRTPPRTEQAILRQVGIRARRAFRPSDQVILGRVGPRNIGIIVTLDVEIALLCADRVRLGVSKSPVTIDGISRAVTASIAVAPNCLSVRDLVTSAEAALLDARKRGGNAVARATP